MTESDVDQVDRVPTPISLPTFDPSKYITKVGGSDYLEVKWRLVWLRSRHPDALIETTLMEHGEDAAVFRAAIRIPDGGYSTGWGSETMRDFRDYIEKAETKALGRALAALGFGTQFCPDFEFSEGAYAAGPKIVDSPVDFASTRGRRVGASEHPVHGGYAGPPNGGGQTVTPRQLKFIQAIARESGLDDAAIAKEVAESFGCTVDQLGRRDASEFIERLQARRGTELSS